MTRQRKLISFCKDWIVWVLKQVDDCSSLAPVAATIVEQPTIAIRSYLHVSFYMLRVELAATIVACFGLSQGEN
ncbi:hypothetical protein Bca101_068037 [Brassica carinata]